MSEPETFVARWSRLKRRAEPATEDEDAKTVAQPVTDVAPTTAGGAAKAAAGPAESPSPVFDPASLPPIESITAGTDIRAFLQSGVPAELTKAALRRVWTTDPAIRDFIGIAENQWDFTDPTAMPGFGPLEATDDVRKLVAQAMGRLGETAEQLAEATGVSDQAAVSGVQRSIAPASRAPAASGIQEPGMPEENRGHTAPVAGAGDEQSRVDIAARDDRRPAKSSSPLNRRGRGSALPQ